MIYQDAGCAVRVDGTMEVKGVNIHLGENPTVEMNYIPNSLSDGRPYAILAFFWGNVPVRIYINNPQVLMNIQEQCRLGVVKFLEQTIKERENGS